jgi:hypothetical protein
MLAEADYSLTEQAHLGESARYSGDDKLLVQFYSHAHHNQSKSAEAGRPIFEQVDYVRIMQPGNKDSIIERPARDTDKQRFRRQYEFYKTHKDGVEVEGTPLTEWPGITRAQAEELKYFNVLTVEQLVGMSDSNAQKIMGVNLLRQRAKAYLEAAEIESAAEALQERDNKIKELEGVILKLSARLDALEDE